MHILHDNEGACRDLEDYELRQRFSQGQTDVPAARITALGKPSYLSALAMTSASYLLE